MAEHIPFINSRTDFEIARDMSSGSSLARISLELLKKRSGDLSDLSSKRWIDAGIDGFVQPSVSDDWRTYSDTFASAQQIRADIQNPRQLSVDAFVNSV